ncbi:MAG TPA: ABC transporter ATP-binding protein [Geminicoccus sp.]|jgi:multiple sugar transport system ATP-binding protein|uniref:ABC transporter ATP-binding protein n=1 Tax=Geminicoccus sp. TaxID=2024832 RepID=UPI002E32C794|nr:ABC transporter ATP-binding protein [Geminicoccus sp.]HEX2529707.1 ABC transporter ATP-binding protein [Geminicoccus sp.]
MTVLHLRGLSKDFGVKQALRDVSFDLEEGEVLALLGPTGAGKTTTLRCIAGLEKPDSGSVFLDGIDVTATSPRERDVAVVFEGFNLLPTLSVFDNIAFPLRSPVYRRPEDEVKREVAQAATTLRIAHLLERRIEQLSGGEKQRVAIARALVRRPRVYLLDEPLSALDLKLRESLQTEIKAMYQSTGATVIYASHDYPSAAAIATRMALIENGRVLQCATLPKMIDDPDHASVGKLVGSPAMAQFPARSGRNGVEIDGLPVVLPGVRASQPLIVGIWPEDMELSTSAGPGFVEGSVYATDFRGRDQAIEIRAASYRFRKVVDLDLPLQQGDTLWFRLPPDKVFTFDAASGERIRDAQGRRAA